MNETNQKHPLNLLEPAAKFTRKNQQRTLKQPCSQSSKPISSSNINTIVSGIFIVAAPFVLGFVSAEPVSLLAPVMVDRLLELIPYLGLSLCLMTIVTIAVWFRRTSNKIVYSVAPAMSLMIGLFCGLACIY